MRHFKLASLVMAGSVALAACSDQVTEPSRLSVRGAADPSLAAASAGPGLGANAALLQDAASDLQRPTRSGGAIDPRSYVCPASTPITDWFYGELLTFYRESPSKYTFLYNMLADELPMYEALLLEAPGKQQYYGYKGEYTNVMQRTERDVKRFWDIDSEDIKVVPMHGTTLTDVSKVAATYQALFVNDDGSPITDADAREMATQVRDTVLSSPALKGGNHPWFTFNSVAFRAIPSLGLPPTIIMGDGIMEGYRALGFGDVAPQAIFAHEFAHQIQFANGYSLPADGFPAASAAERTRYTELMADAFSAYYLTHKRGGAMNKHRVAKFLEAFFQIGDCGFTSSGHHGTPNQRMAAAQFGFDVADQAQKQGHILTSEQFHELFVQKYPELIAPDAT